MNMELNRPQRRALLAMCCVVARSDGEVSAAEYEQLLDLLTRMAHGSVGFSELDDWMRRGPPPFDVRLPEDCIKMFLREAIALARADGKVAEVEIATIKDLVQKYFDAPSAPSP
jgi:tellurite resistance protein